MNDQYPPLTIGQQGKEPKSLYVRPYGTANGPEREAQFDLSGEGKVFSNITESQAKALIERLQAVFPERVCPEPFTTAGFTGTKLEVSRDWNDTLNVPLPYVTVRVAGKPVSMGLGEAKRMAAAILDLAEGAAS